MNGLHEKYRVFREPEDVFNQGHPLPITAYTKDPSGLVVERVREIEDFVFVLKPSTDPAAKIALAAYAEACRATDEQLSQDLYDLLLDNHWGAR